MRFTKRKKKAAVYEPFVFRPHRGQQTKYFTSTAKIVIAGGSAGGGKTMALLVDPLQGVEEQNYDAALFRKTLVQHKMGGGLRAESAKFYPKVPGAEFNKQELLWEWPATNAKIKFYGMDEPQKFDGLQTKFIGIDQVEQFTSDEFWYIQSRLRTSSGRPTKVRCTCNPEPGWLEQLLKSGGYVGEDGLPESEMDGKIRWLLKNPRSDEVLWQDTQDGFGPIDADGVIVEGRYKGLFPKSFTFIRFLLTDNPSLPKEYVAELQNLPYAERRKKLEGNWNQYRGSGIVYKGTWWGLSETGQWVDSPNRFELVPRDESISWCYAWDVGWSTKSDWSYGALVGQGVLGWYIGDAIRFRAREHVTFDAIRACSMAVGKNIPIVLPKDPGKAGLDQEGWMLELGKAGHWVEMVPDDGKAGDKVSRHRFLSPQAERGHLKFVTDWHPTRNVSRWLTTVDNGTGHPVECTTTDEWARELVGFMDALSPDCAHAVTDATDAVARGFRYLTENADPVTDVQLARSMLPMDMWPKEDNRTRVAAIVTSQWGRRQIGDGGRDPGGDFLDSSPFAKRGSF